MDESFAYIDKKFAHSLIKEDDDLEIIHFLSSLMKCTREGSLFLDAKQELKKRLTPLCCGEKSPLVAFENSYYLRRIWELETRCIEQIKRLMLSSFKEPFTPTTTPTEFYPAQKKAFETILTSPLTIISGGPGSGKTFFASRLIESLPGKKIIGAAPTGKAASRLRFKKVQTGTLHSLLKLQKNKEHIFTPLIADLILIDECSMIDLELWAVLLEAIVGGAHVVFIGDPNQLPPVETMGIFSSLCNQKEIPHIHFNQSIRTDKSGILQLATAIKKEDISTVLSLLKNESYPEIQLLPLSSKIPIEKRTLLTPFVKGPHGTALCNKVIDAALQETIKPIVIEKNATSLCLVNGDIGTLKEEQATFSLLGETKTFPKAILPPYSLAYAVTVHKSQGSEFSHISLLLPPESEKFGKELLYTAVTRAKESLIIYSEESTLTNIIKKKSTAPSHFNKRLTNLL